MVEKSSRLHFCNFKLDTLLKVTKLINNNVSVEDLLASYEDLLTNKLSLGKLLVLAYNNGWQCLLQSGLENGEYESINVEANLLPITEITTVRAAGMNNQLPGLDTIIPVFHNERPVAYVLFGDIDEEQEGLSPTIKHLLFIQTLTNIIIVAIENRRLVQESLRQEALKKELELASRMQAMLIPNSAAFPHNEHIAVEAFYLPHLEVGGDYYDFFPLSNKEYAFCMSDVSGKGISAAILMSNFQANLKALFTDRIPLDDLVNTLNQRVLSSANGEKFITLFLGKYNVETRQLHYVNAGHNPPFLFDKVNTRVELLKSGCPGMGMLDELPFVKVTSLTIEGPAKILCYTDGLVELRGEDTTDAGMQAVIDVFASQDDIATSLSQLVSELSINRDNQNFFDDISILGLELF